jgi:hypothetical protein
MTASHICRWVLCAATGSSAPLQLVSSRRCSWFPRAAAVGFLALLHTKLAILRSPTVSHFADFLSIFADNSRYPLTSPTHPHLKPQSTSRILIHSIAHHQNML